MQVEVRLYQGKTHTQPLIEDAMRGGQDMLCNDVLGMVSALGP